MNVLVSNRNKIQQVEERQFFLLRFIYTYSFPVRTCGVTAGRFNAGFQRTPLNASFANELML